MCKICIFAGTTEARRLVELLSTQPVSVTACVATEYGETLLPEGGNVTVRSGRIPVDGIIQMLSDTKFDLVIDATHPYAVRDKAYDALLDLVTDICKRNGIKKLVWSTSKNNRVGHLNGCNMTVHRDYAAKACPGDYLYNLQDEIAAEVNRQLGSSSSTPSTGGTTGSAADIKVGDVVEFTGTKHYVSSTAKTASSCKPGKAKVTALAKGKAHPYHLIAVSGGGSTVYGWTDAADIKTSAAATATSYLVKVTTDVLNIRKGPGTNYGTNGDIRDKGVYTIVAESDGPGASKWGKLKSGAGWISLDYAAKV